MAEHKNHFSKVKSLNQRKFCKTVSKSTGICTNGNDTQFIFEKRKKKQQEKEKLFKASLHTIVAQK